MNAQRIRCGNCSQVLSVKAELAGKQIRCPSCNSTMVVPMGSSPAAKPTSTKKSNTATASANNTKIVSCTKCGTRLSVKVQEGGTVVDCPKCHARLRIGGSATSKPASYEKPSSKEATSVPVTSKGQPQRKPTAPTPSSARASTTGAPVESTPTAQGSGSQSLLDDVDLGHVDLGQSSSESPPAYTRPRPKKSSSGARPMLHWIKNHRAVTALGVMNIFNLVLAPFAPALSITLMVYGLPIIGLLFLPRFNILQRISESFGSELASVGMGGMLLAFLGVMVKIAARTGRNDNINWNALVNSESFGTLIGVLITFLVIVVTFIILWRYVGIVRTFALGYSLIWVLSIPVFAITILKKYPPGKRSTVVAQQESVEPNEFQMRPTQPTLHQRRPSFRPPPTFNDRNAFPQQPTTPSVSQEQRNERALPATQSRESAFVMNRGVVRRRINIPLPDGASIVLPSTPIEKGARLQACWARKWSWVTVVNVNEDGTLKVKWDGWGSVYDMLREDLVVESNE